jgi:hypothetical protein
LNHFVAYLNHFSLLLTDNFTAGFHACGTYKERILTHSAMLFMQQQDMQQQEVIGPLHSRSLVILTFVTSLNYSVIAK